MWTFALFWNSDWSVLDVFVRTFVTSAVTWFLLFGVNIVRFRTGYVDMDNAQPDDYPPPERILDESEK